MADDKKVPEVADVPKDAKRVPYRLPELLAAAPSSSRQSARATASRSSAGGAASARPPRRRRFVLRIGMLSSQKSPARAAPMLNAASLWAPLHAPTSGPGALSPVVRSGSTGGDIAAPDRWREGGPA